MAVSRSERRELRRAGVAAVVGDDEVGAALDLLELVELAWHDCYGEITPSDAVVDDMLVLSRGHPCRIGGGGTPRRHRLA